MKLVKELNKKIDELLDDMRVRIDWYQDAINNPIGKDNIRYNQGKRDGLREALGMIERRYK